jgi:hypothetical protein
MIWAASSITQGSVELYAQSYYLLTLQIFFPAMDAILLEQVGERMKHHCEVCDLPFPDS